MTAADKHPSHLKGEFAERQFPVTLCGVDEPSATLKPPGSFV